MNNYSNFISKIKINDKIYFNHLNKLDYIYKTKKIKRIYKYPKLNKSKNKYKLHLLNKKNIIINKENEKFIDRLSQIKPTKIITNSKKYKKKINNYVNLNKKDTEKIDFENKKYFERLINKKSKYNKNYLSTKKLIKKNNIKKGREIWNFSYKILEKNISLNNKDDFNSFRNN